MKGVLALVVTLAVAATAAGSTGGPPTGLSKRGRALWNFEALLHDTFGNRPVCMAGTGLNFVAPANRCTPLAKYSPYIYVFSGAQHSAFHLVRRRPHGSFGNYPVLVRINGRYIACDPHGRTFLIEYGDSVNFALDCLRPL